VVTAILCALQLQLATQTASVVLEDVQLTSLDLDYLTSVQKVDMVVAHAVVFGLPLQTILKTVLPSHLQVVIHQQEIAWVMVPQHMVEMRILEEDLDGLELNVSLTVLSRQCFLILQDLLTIVEDGQLLIIAHVLLVASKTTASSTIHGRVIPGAILQVSLDLVTHLVLHVRPPVYVELQVLAV